MKQERNRRVRSTDGLDFMSLELNIKHDDEIVLPARIAQSKLTLAQIGAIACMACLENAGGDLESMADRLNSAEMQATMKELAELKVFTVGREGNTVTMRLDLGPVGL